MNKYNNKYHKIILKKPVDLNPTMHVDFNKETIRKVLNLELVITLERQNIKTFSQRVMFQIGLMKFLWLQKFKILSLDICY